MGLLVYSPSGSNLSNTFEERESLMMDWEEKRQGDQGMGGRAKRMGEGLFVHALNSLGVISIACSIIISLDKEKTLEFPF